MGTQMHPLALLQSSAITICVVHGVSALIHSDQPCWPPHQPFGPASLNIYTSYQLGRRLRQNWCSSWFHLNRSFHLMFPFSWSTLGHLGRRPSFILSTCNGYFIRIDLHKHSHQTLCAYSFSMTQIIHTASPWLRSSILLRSTFFTPAIRLTQFFSHTCRLIVFSFSPDTAIV